jgi:endonuclease/exonuclease/phosphatase family metal-dependent hydrolase
MCEHQRSVRPLRLALITAASVVLLVAPALPAHTAGDACAARATAISWHHAAQDDAVELERWCHAVGTPIVSNTSAGAGVAPPALDDLVVLTWNAHLAEGRLAEVVTDLRAGRLTDGRPVMHFVLLVQELYRRGPDVPPYTDRARSAIGIVPRDPHAPDAAAYAASLGLSFLYVPSMRNGAQVLEDRGNAIISTEPLLDPLALELPLERQRRVAIGAAVAVTVAERTERLQFINAHLEPLSSPRSLWIFRNPRTAQARAILELLETPRFEDGTTSAGTVLGGDFNLVQRGVDEDAYVATRRWSSSLASENQRRTHLMGRIDHLFFRLDRGWNATTRRLDRRYGSDHFPVLGIFSRNAG